MLIYSQPDKQFLKFKKAYKDLATLNNRPKGLKEEFKNIKKRLKDELKKKCFYHDWVKLNGKLIHDN